MPKNTTIEVKFENGHSSKFFTIVKIVEGNPQELTTRLGLFMNHQSSLSNHNVGLTFTFRYQLSTNPMIIQKCSNF